MPRDRGWPDRRPKDADVLTDRGAVHRVSERAGRGRQGRAGRELQRGRGASVHAARPERLRQDDDAALHCRPRAAARRRDLGQRPCRLFVVEGRVRGAEPARLRHGVPVLRHLAAHERVPERRLSARSRRPRATRARRSATTSCACSPPCSSTTSPIARRPSSPAASSSAWRSRARWRCSRRCSCSTSRCRTSTRSCARRCASS